MSNIVQLSDEFQTEPSNRTAEQAVLGAVIINNRAYAELAVILRPEHFFDGIYGAVFKRMGGLIADGKTADAVTLSSEMCEPELERHLGDMARAAAPIVDAPTYASLIVEACHKRWLRAACLDAARRAASDEYEYLDNALTLAWEVKEAMSRIEQDVNADSFMSLDQAGERLGLQISRRIKPMPTGLPTLDKSLDGGLRVENLYVIEAPAKTFKTGALGTIAYQLIKDDVPFLFVSLEMSPEQILARLVSAETGCNATDLMDAERHDDAIGRVQVFRDRYGRRKGFFADRPGIKEDGLAALCATAIVKFGVQVIFIDYWQRIGGKGRNESTAEHLEDIAYWAADFSRKNSVSVVMASQLNRDGSSFRSGGVERACSWLARMARCEQTDRFTGDVQAIWMEIPYTRFSQDLDLGGPDNPAFRIDGIGPVLREIGDWRKGADHG